MKIVETERLILRTWKDEDREPYFKFNQDPKVTEFLIGPMSYEKVETFIRGANQQHFEKGYTLWAAELKETNQFIGFIGLNYTDWPAHFTPAVEVGWRLGYEFWGNGYATEGAKAAVAFGFEKCNLDQIVSFTVPDNLRSIRVMEKIGMNRDLKGDFLHPNIPNDHKLSKHILYRISHK